MGKELVLVNSARPDLSQLVSASGHRMTNIRTQGGRTLADFDGETWATGDIFRWLNDRYRFEQRSALDPKQGTGMAIEIVRTFS